MWLNYKQYGLKTNPITNGVYKIIRKSDNKVMSVGSSRNLYDRFAKYNKIIKGTQKCYGIKDFEIKEHYELYTIEIIETNLPIDELRIRESHWQRVYKTNYRDDGWDIMGARWSAQEKSKKYYNLKQHNISRQKRFEEHPEKHEQQKQKQKEWYQNNKNELKAKKKMQTLFKNYPLNVRKFYKVNFNTWINALIAYEVYEATTNMADELDQCPTLS